MIRKLVPLVLCLIPSLSGANEAAKSMVERIISDAGEVVILHKVRSLEVDGRELTQTFGAVVDATGIKHHTSVVRVYDCPPSVLPGFIERNLNNPVPHDVDKYLLFETGYEKPGAVKDVKLAFDNSNGNFKLYSFRIGNQVMTYMIGVFIPNTSRGYRTPKLEYLLFKCPPERFPSLIEDEYYYMRGSMRGTLVSSDDSYFAKYDPAFPSTDEDIKK
jgi:hypothetical protein